MDHQEAKDLLERYAQQYNHPDFIENDPISIPHQFTKKEDIEVAAFFAAIFAWGQRITIINKSNLLMKLMGNSPHAFLLHHTEGDLKQMKDFAHRTFQPTDLFYFIERLKRFYTEYDSLEDVFSKYISANDSTVEKALIGFRNEFFNMEFSPKRTEKHVASPAKNSTCKRLNMFLRWMVRKDNRGVDFGLWDQIRPSQLMIPFDVHVERMARDLQLLQRKQRDWKAVKELTANLRVFDPEDPVKYDFALFGYSVNSV